jgi:hypothetical protein
MTQTQHEPIEVVEKVHLHFIKKWRCTFILRNDCRS